MLTVGRAWAIIKGRQEGDPKEAQDFLKSMPASEASERNKQDSRARGSIKPKKPYKLGQSVRVRNG